MYDNQVPTIAIETVYIQENTSIIQDEVLSHRLGLIPIKVDPKLFEDFEENGEATDQNTVVFCLDASCKQSTKLSNDKPSLVEVVYSNKLEWQPQGNQLEKFPGLI